MSLRVDLPKYNIVIRPCAFGNVVLMISRGFHELSLAADCTDACDNFAKTRLVNDWLVNLPIEILIVASFSVESFIIQQILWPEA